MGVPYNDIIRQVAVRINALTNGTLPTALEAAYVISPLTAADVAESSIFPFTAIKDSVLLAEQKLSQTIADVRDHPWRAYLVSQTEPLANRANQPAQDENGISIIGVYGDIFDSADNRQLFAQPAEVIERRLATPALWKIPVYHYALTGDSIIHTRPNVRIQVCVWDYLDRQAAIDANDDMLLPDVLAQAIVCGAIAILCRDDEWLNQAKVYAEYFADTITAIKRGATTLPVEEAA